MAKNEGSYLFCTNGEFYFSIISFNSNQIESNAYWTYDINDLGNPLGGVGVSDMIDIAKMYQHM